MQPPGPPTPRHWGLVFNFDNATALSQPSGDEASAAASTSAAASGAAAEAGTSASATDKDKTNPETRPRRKSLISFFRKLPNKIEKFKKRLFGNNEEERREEASPLLLRRANRAPRIRKRTTRANYNPVSRSQSSISKQIVNDKDIKYWDRDQWEVPSKTISPRACGSSESTSAGYSPRTRRSPRPRHLSSQSTQSTPGSYSGAKRYLKPSSVRIPYQTLPSHATPNIEDTDYDSDLCNMCNLSISTNCVFENERAKISKSRRKRALDKKKSKSMQMPVGMTCHPCPCCSRSVREDEEIRKYRPPRRRRPKYSYEIEETDFDQLFKIAESWAQQNIKSLDSDPNPEDSTKTKDLQQ